MHTGHWQACMHRLLAPTSSSQKRFVWTSHSPWPCIFTMTEEYRFPGFRQIALEVFPFPYAAVRARCSNFLNRLLSHALLGFLLAQVALVLFTPQLALPIDPVQIEIIRMLGTGYVAASVSFLALKVASQKTLLAPHSETLSHACSVFMT